QAFLVESFHRSPVERLPNALTIVPPQQQQREHAVINSVVLVAILAPLDRAIRPRAHCSRAVRERRDLSHDSVSLGIGNSNGLCGEPFAQAAALLLRMSTKSYKAARRQC